MFSDDLIAALGGHLAEVEELGLGVLIHDFATTVQICDATERVCRTALRTEKMAFELLNRYLIDRVHWGVR
jgi:hypothetical protein